MDLEQALELFIDHLQVERNLAVNTVVSYRHDLQLLLDYLRPSDVTDVGAVTPDALAGFIQAEITQACRATTQARRVSAMRQFFLYLQRNGHCETNPARRLQTPKWQRTLPGSPDIEQTSRLLDMPQQMISRKRALRDQSMLELLYGAGLRASEVCHLAVDDLQLDAGLVRVRGKGDKERLVPLGGCAIEALQGYLQHERPLLPWAAGVPHLFVGQRGRPISRMALYKIVRMYSDMAGLHGRVSPHTLRHAFATHLVQGGADLRAVQEMLGHASIVTTEIYTHVTSRNLSDTVHAHHPLEISHVEPCKAAKK